MLVLQGDLNSRTVLEQGNSSGGDDDQPLEARDILSEVLSDIELQDAIQNRLPVTPGRWQEVGAVAGTSALPVTYKYNEEVGDAFRRTSSAEAQAAGYTGENGGVGVPTSSLTIGDIMAVSSLAADGCGPGPKMRSLSEFIGPSASLPSSPKAYSFTTTPKGSYKQALDSVPETQLRAWNIQFKRGDFQPFRFPAATERVLYWAPNELLKRVRWLSHGGYDVNHTQGGSDHRPVILEATLEVGPAPKEQADACSTTPKHACCASVELCRAVSLGVDDAENSEPGMAKAL
jgi:hypothetical protein